MTFFKLGDEVFNLAAVTRVVLAPEKVHDPALPESPLRTKPTGRFTAKFALLGEDKAFNLTADQWERLEAALRQDANVVDIS